MKKTDQLPLADIQANILKPHGRKFARFIFFKFRSNNQLAIRSWLSEFASQDVTSAARQQMDRDRYVSSNGKINETLVCFFLTACGYRKLGIREEALPNDPGFRSGMKSKRTRKLIGDYEAVVWESGYRRNNSAMILLADDRQDKLMEKAKEMKQKLIDKGIAQKRFIFIDKGRKLTHRFSGEQKAVAVEHFGYADGGSKINDFKKIWQLAITEEPGRMGRYGSYFVFRKLKQNVRKFNTLISELEKKIVANNSRELAEAQVVGRFKNGTPLTSYDKPQKRASWKDEELKYVNDEGQRCPLHAHIRKANPRDRQSGNKKEKIEIIRRGMPYGEPGSGEEPGLLFMSYQASIAKQFELIQATMCNNPDFPKANPSTGQDPIVYQRINSNATEIPQRWNKKWNTKNNISVAFFGDVVELRGGAYFFAPSIPFLKNLKYGRGARDINENSPILCD